MFNEIKTYLKSMKQTIGMKKHTIKYKVYIKSLYGRTQLNLDIMEEHIRPKVMRYVTKLNPDNYVDFMSLLENHIGKEEYKVPTIGGDLKNINIP